jgi:hypothetical protein
MCTPQIQQAIAGAQAAGIIPGQQVNPQEAITEGTVSAGIQPFDPRMKDPRYAGHFGATAQQISELFDPRTGQVTRQVGPPKEMQVVPISRAEFDEEGPVMSDSIQSIPQHMMRKEYAPMQPIQRIQRSPTVGEILGIKPGQYEEVGGPGDFRNLNVPLR